MDVLERVAAPRGRQRLYRVSCTGKKACVALGWGNPVLSKSYQWVMESGIGNAWRESLTPQPTKFPIPVLDDIACSSSQRCTIVGYNVYGLAETSSSHRSS